MASCKHIELLNKYHIQIRRTDIEGTIGLSSLTGASNLFTALIVGILFSELLIWLQSIEKLEIKLPEQVPPMVANSFSALIPAFLSFFVAAVISIILLATKIKKTTDYIAFGPFIVIATVVTMIIPASKSIEYLMTVMHK